MFFPWITQEMIEQMFPGYEGVAHFMPSVIHNEGKCIVCEKEMPDGWFLFSHALNANIHLDCVDKRLEELDQKNV